MRITGLRYDQMMIRSAQVFHQAVTLTLSRGNVSGCVWRCVMCNVTQKSVSAFSSSSLQGIIRDAELCVNNATPELTWVVVVGGAPTIGVRGAEPRNSKINFVIFD